MGMKPGPKPKGQVKTIWSPEFAYAIGLFTADGCVSGDGRHLDFTSKDRAQVETFNKCLNISPKVALKNSGHGTMAYHSQFGDVLFCNFLQSIGLTSAKSKTITHVDIPDQYFSDFLRGYFDGDGTSYSFYDSLFPKSYRFYVSFMSASPLFIDWLRAQLISKANIKGHLSYAPKNKTHVQLKYSKKEAIIISKYMYYDPKVPFLERKFLKIGKSMRIMREAWPKWEN